MVVADLPPQFRFNGSAKGYRLAGNGENSRKLVLGSDFTFTVIGESNTAQYVTLDDVKCGADTIF